MDKLTRVVSLTQITIVLSNIFFAFLGCKESNIQNKSKKI